MAMDRSHSEALSLLSQLKLLGFFVNFFLRLSLQQVNFRSALRLLRNDLSQFSFSRTPTGLLLIGIRVRSQQNTQLQCTGQA